ncbi:MAG TPA: orotidine-5'-phosphate decarboxylase [Polyangia bacterium]|nr:orotidine-5'-phosphate decarboxylase [Polyangia bacterium]
MHKPAHDIAPRDRVIVACDVPDLAALSALLDRLDGRPSFYKVGLELFVAEGERAVEAVRERGGRIFLDLKLHDIPETVARAVQSARRIEAELLTVHTSGGYEMLSRAAQAAEGRVKILGVTVLTSLVPDDLRAEGIEATIPEMVRARARIAAKAGIAGLVCSSHEIEAARGAAPGLFIVVPGIRPATGAGSAAGDQKRVATPGGAIRDGADYLVVGRPLRDAPDPAKAFEAVVAEVTAALT